MPTHSPSVIMTELLTESNQQLVGERVHELCAQLYTHGVQPGSGSVKRSDDSDADTQGLVDSYLDSVIQDDPTLHQEATRRKCQFLVAGGLLLDQFETAVRETDRSVRCGCVWEPQSLAYRCKTCAKSACMSVCASCFKHADHTDHDYNRFRSQAGGACDCGDETVMHAQGFCSRHGQANASQTAANTEPAPALVCVASYLFPKLFGRLLHSMRSQFCQVKLNDVKVIEAESDRISDHVAPLLAFLNDYAILGGQLRRLLADLLLTRSCYDTINLGLPVSSLEMVCAAETPNADSMQHLFKSLKSVCTVNDAEHFGCSWLSGDSRLDTLLDELIFWLVRLEYPQKLVTFVLSLLPEDDFRSTFAHRFFMFYGRTAESLRVQSRERQRAVAGENLSNRVVHITVQILSGRDLCVQLATAFPIARLVLACVKAMLRPNLMPAPNALGQVEGLNYERHESLSNQSSTIENHQYWPLVTDLHNMLAHDTLATQCLHDPLWLVEWCSLLTYMQGMNTTVRVIRGEHVPFEQRSYYWAYTAELEAASQTMWCLLKACHSQESIPLVCAITEQVIKHIRVWFVGIGFDTASCHKLSRVQVSFHLPLHRYYAAFMVLANSLQLSMPLPDDMAFVHRLMMHPLQIQVSRAEVAHNMWVRNGQDMRYQTYLYVQNSFSASFVDLDLFMLQACASAIQPVDMMLLMILDRFHLRRFLMTSTEVVTYPDSEMRPEWTLPMLEAALRLILTLATQRINNGLSETEQLRLEVASQLCMADRTYSQIKDALPTKGNASVFVDEHMDTILQELADFKAPDLETGQTQGLYVPKSCVWESEFDPLHVHVRAIQARDYAAAVQRYTEHCRTTCTSSLWPPFRVPVCAPNNQCMRLVQCRSMHAVVYVVLYKYWHAPTSMSDEALAMSVHVLWLAVNTVDDQYTQHELKGGTGSVLQHLLTLYNSENVFTNLGTRVNQSNDQLLQGNPELVGLQELLQSNESLLSLLVRIHKRLGDQTQTHAQTQTQDTADLSQLWTPRTITHTHNTHDAHTVIHTLLLHVYKTDMDCRRELDRICASIRRHGTDTRLSSSAPVSVSESNELSFDQRRLQMRQRQQAVLNAFSRKQAHVMQVMQAQEQSSATDTTSTETTTATDEQKMDTTTEEGSGNEKLHCVICACDAEPSTTHPVALIAFCLPSAIIGHMLPEGQPPFDVMRDKEFSEYEEGDFYDSAKCSIRLRRHYASKEKRDVAELCAEPGLYQANMRGVKLRLCSHYVHVSCHKRFMDAQPEELNRPDAFSARLGEFLCPMCRRVSNAILPVWPKPMLLQPNDEPEMMVTDLHEHMQSVFDMALNTTALSRATAGHRADGSFLDSCVASISAANQPHVQTDHGLLIGQLLRYNIEHDLMLVSAGFAQHKLKPVIADLLPVLSSQLVCQKQWQLLDVQRQWMALTGQSAMQMAQQHHTLPLLFVDSFSLMCKLTLLVLNTARNTQPHQSHTQLLVHIYSLCEHLWAVRAACNVQCSMGGLAQQVAVRDLLHDMTAQGDAPLTYWERLFQLVLDTQLHTQHRAKDTHTHLQPPQVNQIDAMMQHRMQPFKALAQSLFDALCLNIDMHALPKDATRVNGLIVSWLTTGLTKAPVSLLSSPMNWSHPQLVALPQSFDELYELYSARACVRCGQVPADVLLCLHCGRFLCHNTKCCQHTITSDAEAGEAVRITTKCEGEWHVMHCGLGCALLLSIQSSLVYAVRGLRGGIWGSVYLDKHGEEDRRLKRGKPLFLCAARYQTLQEQWLQLQPGGTRMRWMWMPDFVKHLDPLGMHL